MLHHHKSIHCLKPNLNAPLIEIEALSSKIRQASWLVEQNQGLANDKQALDEVKFGLAEVGDLFYEAQ